VSTIGIAIVYSNLSVFLGHVGASTGSVICYIVPALFSIKVDDMEEAELHGSSAKSHSKFGRFMQSVKAHPVEWIMILVGILIGIIGTFSEFYSCFKKKDPQTV
jgi:hypothetical protein